MTPSSWSLDMVPPMWTKTAWSSKSAARESTLRSDIQRHFVFERFRISCSLFVCAIAGAEEIRNSAMSVKMIRFISVQPFLAEETFLPEANGLSDPSLGARTDTKTEAVSDAPIPAVLHVGPRPSQRRNPPLHQHRRGDPVDIANGNEGRRFGRSEIGMARVEQDDGRGRR